MRRPNVADENWRLVQALLDEEMSRLHDKYRVPIVLCDLEGRTIKEAARHLNWPQGTVATRLAHGRKQLAKRLAKYDLTLSGAALGPLLAHARASATVPVRLLTSTTKAGSLFATGRATAQGAISGAILTLTERVLTSMFLSKLKLVTAVVLCACLCIGMTYNSFPSTGSAQGVPPPRAKVLTPAAKAENDEDFIRRMSKELRGRDPTLTEIHFFAGSKEVGKRQKLIDLFIQERQATAKPTGGDMTTFNLGNVSYAVPFTLPSAEEILRALPASARPKNASLRCELVTYHVDPSREFPLVGPARLAHAHFKCTVFTNGRNEVVYMDRDHLILQK